MQPPKIFGALAEHAQVQLQKQLHWQLAKLFYFIATLFFGIFYLWKGKTDEWGKRQSKALFLQIARV